MQRQQAEGTDRAIPSDCLLHNPHGLCTWWNIVVELQHCKQSVCIVPRLVTKAYLWLCRDLQRFESWLILLQFQNWSKPHNHCLSIQIHLHSLLLPHGVDLLRGDKNCQNGSSWSALSSGHSKTLDFWGTQVRGRSPDWNSDRMGRQC